jgi:hypothetical protein
MPVHCQKKSKDWLVYLLSTAKTEHLYLIYNSFYNFSKFENLNFSAENMSHTVKNANM